MKKLITITIAMMLLLTACGAGAGTQETTTTEDTGSNKSSLFDSKSIEGEWTDDWSTLITIEGSDVLVEHMGDYLGTVDKKNKTITIKNGARDGDLHETGDATFSYKIVKDKLVLDEIEGDKYNCFGLDKTYSFVRYDGEEDYEDEESTEESEE